MSGQETGPTSTWRTQQAEIARLTALVAEQAREIERLIYATRTRPDYNFRCQDCGAPHNLDTSIPSDVWNRICANTPGMPPGAAGIGMPEVGALCTLCIDERLVKAGLRCDEAEFYFVGRALSSKAYRESHVEQAELAHTQLAALSLAHARVREALKLWVDDNVEHDNHAMDEDESDRCLGCVDRRQLSANALNAPAPDGAKVLAVVKAAFDRDGIADEKAAHRLTCRAWWCEIDDAIARRQVAAAQRERDALAALRADPAWKGVG